VSDVPLNLIKIALTTSVTGLVFAQGLQVSPADLLAVGRRPGLLFRATLAGYVLVPLATLLIVLLVRPALNVEVGLVLLAAGPVAPLMVVRIPRAGGHLAHVIALHLAMTLLALVATPIVLQFMGWALGFDAKFNYARLSWLIGRVVILPVCLGIAIRALWPALATRCASALSRGCGIVFIVIAVAVLALNSGKLLDTSARSFAAMALSVAAALVIGHVLAPPSPAERLTMAMISAARHPGAVLLVAAASFPKADALLVLVPYLFVFLIVSAAYLRGTSAALAQQQQPGARERNGADPFVGESPQ
jgi:BASS family bile acid:Na+ symporter